MSAPKQPIDLLAALQQSIERAKRDRRETAATVEQDTDCYCGSNGGEGCWCCTDECPEDCMADHRGEQ